MFSKAEIDRLGNKIRNEQDNIKEETLIKLQEYRISHKESLSYIFNMLCINTRKVHSSAIATYRIKRFESIIGKLNRFPEMRFNRMWDIGGCRCILRSNEDVYKLKKLINEEVDFEIIKEKDYIKEPQETGYKSLHLFIKHLKHDRIIEVQLRNQIDHNWATLVEITDLLYDSKIKELGNNIELKRFHFLLSKVSELTLDDKRELSKILTKYSYFEKLSEVFSRNYVKVRRQWFEIESKNHNFFLIESYKDEVPKISSFKNSKEAEESYFNVYKTKRNANIVLTHLVAKNFNQISIAYSNYILSFHSFLNECKEILESLIIESLEKKRYFEFFKIYNLYTNLIYNNIKNLISEIIVIRKYIEELKGNSKSNRKKEKEWVIDIENQILKSRIRSNKISQKVKESIPKSQVGKFIVKQLISFISKRYQSKIQSIVKDI